MKLSLAALTLGLAVGFGAAAAPVPSLPGGPIYIKFDNREQIALPGSTTGYAYAPGEINWGVFTVASMSTGVVTAPNDIIETNSSITPFWVNMMNAGQITGMFYGVEAVTPGTNGVSFPATGGYLDLYYRDTAALGSVTDLAASLPSVRTGLNSATGFTDGTLLAHLAFASGINPDGSIFISGTTVPTSGGFAGIATSYANVDTSLLGAWSVTLDQDWFNTSFGTRDLRFRNIYASQSSWDNCPPESNNCVLGAWSTDPATAYVPEPASVALLGLGLLGIAVMRRRRNV